MCLSAYATGLHVIGNSIADTQRDTVVIGGKAIYLLAKSDLRIVSTLPHELWAYEVAASTTGRWIAATTTKGTLDLYDLQDDGASRRLPITHVGHIVFSPDEHWLIAADEGQLAIWDLLSRASEPLRTSLPISAVGRTPIINALRFNATGDRLAFGREDGLVGLLGLAGTRSRITSSHANSLQWSVSDISLRRDAFDEDQLPVQCPVT